MSDIIKSLLAAVETREIDLGECSSLYAGVKLPVRVNWTRGHKKRRWKLRRELAAIQEELKERKGDADIDDLNKRADENAEAWTGWWSGAFMMTPDETGELQDTLPPPHWEWLTGKIIKTVSEYEADETKKVLGLLGRSSGEPERKAPTSGTDSPSQDG